MENGEGIVFTGVSLSTLGEGVPQSQVLSQVTGPSSFPVWYSSPRFFPRSLVPVPFCGYPSPGQGVPQSWWEGNPDLAGGTPT